MAEKVTKKIIPSTSHSDWYFILGACLIPRLTVQEDGSLSCPVTTSNSYHDVTGGIKLKLDSAALITRLGQGHPPVFICQIGSPSANSAVLSGTLDEGSGTMILYDSSR